jgi:hypothetical protein
MEETKMKARGTTHLTILLALALVLPSSRSGAELAAWDQANVAKLATQLEASTEALYETFRRQPSSELGSIKRESYFRLKQLVRMLRSEATVFAASLKHGEGREETAWNYETLMSLTRSARDEARRVFVATDLSERATAVRQVLNQLGPYYDPDFQALVPHPNIEPAPRP